MTRKEFIDALSAKLDKLPKEELENALDYYNEIFDEAGEDKEEQTAEELGSIDDIARQIYTENGIDPDGRPKFLMDEYIDAANRERAGAESEQPYVSPFQPRQDTAKGIGLILFILLFPVWFPIVTVILTLAFVFTVLLFVLEIVFAVCGVAGVVTGTVFLFRIPPIGMAYFGFGLFLTGLFLITFRGAFKGIKNGMVGAINGVVRGCRKVIMGGAA